MSELSHVIGFDDAPFSPDHRGDVLVVGAVFRQLRLEGVLSGKVRRDGANATRVLAGMVSASRFAPQLQAVLLQGIAMAGFNVIDIAALQQILGETSLKFVVCHSCLIATKQQISLHLLSIK